MFLLLFEKLTDDTDQVTDFSAVSENWLIKL